VDQERKTGVRWPESEQLGPYRLQEQVVETAPGQAELYRATHEVSGATALVLKPGTDDDSLPLSDWRVRCVSSASPSFLALEVEHSSWSVPSKEPPAEALVCVFEDVRGAVRRLGRAFSAPHQPRLRWRLGLASAGAAAVCALAFALVRQLPVSPPPGAPDAPVASAAPSPLGQEIPTDALRNPRDDSPLLSLPDGSPSALARPLPDRPYIGQARPPCKPRLEVEINGGCWMPHRLKAPCPHELFEHKGECYAVVTEARPLPQSLGR
jgi:hypothetical protein